jgi:hypothetical protein
MIRFTVTTTAKRYTCKQYLRHQLRKVVTASVNYLTTVSLLFNSELCYSDRDFVVFLSPSKQLLTVLKKPFSLPSALFIIHNLQPPYKSTLHCVGS